MAGAEARAVWQRTVNRCFVQEDAKRAPRLACSQSSPSASTKQADSGSSGAIDLPDQPASNSMPISQNPRFPNLPPDTRWWVHMRPSYINQKGLADEPIHPLEPEKEIPREVFVNSPVKDNDDLHPKDEQEGTNSEKCNYGVGEKELNTFKCENVKEFIELMETGENYGFVEMDHGGFGSFKKSCELSFDLASPWNISSQKTEPWWRTTDKDELASLVAQRSPDYIENCDLPTPQKRHTRKYPHRNSTCFGCDGLSSLDQKSQASYISNLNVLEDAQQRISTEGGHVLYGSEKTSSHSTNHNDKTETDPHTSETGLSKAELLEALRLSQTRAREAEEAAKEACAEKEHLVKLLFKQASQLFAYRQWLQLLQLEALYLQIKNSDPPISTLPWMPYEGRKVRKKGQKGKRVKRDSSKPDVTTYAVAFALGLSLVGAGLLLGWTVGWMLPF